MAETGHHYALCGWRVASAIDLPELPRWPDAPGSPDVTIEFGHVPADIPEIVLETPFLQVNRSGVARHAIPGVANYMTERGDRITIDLAAGVAPESPEVRLFLLGTVFGVLCNQRGVLPLHACSVEVDGGAIAFAGPSGAGKSTLAAAFHRLGFKLLSDDVTPVSFDDDGVRFLPGLRRMRLWADSIDAFGWDRAGLERCREGLEKFSRRLDDGFGTEAVKPLALFHLQSLPLTAGEVMFRELQGAGAVQALRNQVYRWRSLNCAAGQIEANTRVVRAAAGIPKHFELWRRVEYRHLETTIATVLETVRLSR